MSEPRHVVCPGYSKVKRVAAARFGIQGTLTLLFFVQGREVARQSGAIGETPIEQRVRMNAA